MNQRKIKFRVYNQNLKRFIDSDTTRGMSHYYDIFSGNFHCYDSYYRGSVEFENTILQQFTGFLDSKGKEIYEGDIVHYECPLESDRKIYKKLLTSAVTWESDRWRILYSADYYFWNKMTILGNIFENPELLNKK